SIFYLLLLAVLAVTVIGVLTAPFYVPLLINYDSADAVAQIDAAEKGVEGVLPGSVDWREAASVRAVQYMFPFLIFIALSAWAMGVLNTYRYFFMPAVASAFFNISLILGCAFGAGYYENLDLMMYLSLFVLLGGALQFIVQIPNAYAIRHFPPKWVSPFQPIVKEFIVKMSPGILGLAIYQLNNLISQTYFATQYGSGSVSVMNYASRFIQFPLGVVGVALATASFPRIAQHIELQRKAEASQTLTDVSKYLLLLMLPAAVGLIVLGEDIIGMIYNRGEFAANAWLRPTAILLAVYSLGLFSLGLIKVLVRVIQAHHDFVTPVKIGGLAFLVNLLLCFLFTQLLPLWSLAVASICASGVQAALLLIVTKRLLREFTLTPIVLFGIRILIASIGMGIVCYFGLQWFPLEANSLLQYFIRVMFGLGLGFITYGLLGWLLFKAELKKIVKIKD
ncbi:hypothetical protein GF373_01670, partial [bacterium]|nr:hypothetical protein [bacterium]